MDSFIVIPTYNEKGNLNKLTSKIIKLDIKNLGLIIVDDNSPDGTGALADNLAKKYKRKIFVIHRKRKLGLGSAYKSGFKEAQRKKAKVVLTMDADLSHDPVVIPKLIKKTESYEVVIGSRYTKGGKIIGFNLWRKLLSFFAQMLSKFLLGLKTQDSTSGYRAYRLEVLKSIKADKIKSEGYSFLIEAVYKAQRKGFSIAEVPITFKARTTGKSKVSEKEIYKAIATIFRLSKSKLIT